ncbi:hypothetical protein Ae263Ps1_6417 [Pseudonocardia sp. Ae263_Ps1]|nr:hypothetical protein Ae263Ps1_6417 [Pseudonocardia sp. Ae263_Ps1]
MWGAPVITWMQTVAGRLPRGSPATVCPRNSLVHPHLRHPPRRRVGLVAGGCEPVDGAVVTDERLDRPEHQRPRVTDAGRAPIAAADPGVLLRNVSPGAK